MHFEHLILGFLICICNLGCAQKSQSGDAAFLPELVNVVKENHLAPQVINNQLSKKIFNSFIKSIDPEKRIFTLQEINQLRAYEETLDDAFKTGNSLFFEMSIKLLMRSIARANDYSNQFLNKKINVSQDHYFETNSSKIDFPDNEKGLMSRWKSIVKYRFIQDLYIVEITDPNLTETEQKEIALEKTKGFFADYFYQISSQTREILLETYVNSYISNNDYQSEFLFPSSKAKWDSKFNRSFVGIGVSIEATMDYPKVSNVIFDGPAWKTKRLNKGDFLIKISNAENKLIDVVGFSLSEITTLLKGKAGSTVKVMVKNSENNIEEIVIERGVISMTKVMSFILRSVSNKKIGYIYLPRFYSGNESCSSHVLREIERLKENKVEAIIFDVRNNHGGSAREAIQIMGYFLDGGVVMQAKYSNGQHRVFRDEDLTSQYTGKLIILVNERSSSASELFAGTMQDYKRAVVIGSQTYGKGTIQRFIEVSDENKLDKIGDVKLSIGSFYTAHGRSTQYTGIIPDIILPSKKMYLLTGERCIENTLKFKNLDSTKVKIDPDTEQYMDKLLVFSKNRQLKNDYWLSLLNAAKLEEYNLSQSLINLNYKTYKSKKDNLKNPIINYPKIKKYIVMDISSSEYEQLSKENWKNKLENDNFLYESFLITNDYLKMN